LGAGAGAAAFAVVDNWTAFGLFAAATLLALIQLSRILLRKKASGDADGHGKRRW
jgi:hypothetical protein